MKRKSRVGRSGDSAVERSSPEVEEGSSQAQLQDDAVGAETDFLRVPYGLETDYLPDSSLVVLLCVNCAAKFLITHEMRGPPTSTVALILLPKTSHRLLSKRVCCDCCRPPLKNEAESQ